jgi:hypothetical protein
MFKKKDIRGTCNCGQWQVSVRVNKSAGDLNPRICDCEYCKAHPSALISDPSMEIDFTGGRATFDQNGDRLAKFYRCESCGDLLAVGCYLSDVLRGAVSSQLFGNTYRFGEPILIQPWKLSGKERLERWGKLWGVINGI